MIPETASISLWHLGLAFLEGLSVVVSPCVLPVLPILLSATVTGERARHFYLSRPFGVIVGFVLAFTAFTLLSRQLVVSLGLIGLGMDVEVIRKASFYLLLLFGLTLLFPVLSEKFASWTQGLSQLGNRIGSKTAGFSGTDGGFWSGLLLGSCIGLVWVPCVGPILAAVIIQSVQQQTTLASVFTVISFAMGAGVPMVLIAMVLAVGGKTIMNRLRALQPYSGLVRKALGILILATVFWSAQDSLFPLPGYSKASNTGVAGSPKLIHALPNPYPAPLLAGLTNWINSKPLTMAQLKGKVVLVDFWTYSCINCVRTLPYIKAWDERYRDKGLVILGIHAPEFEFEKKPENVQQAVQKHGLHYPVASDNLYGTWRNFNNRYWPAHYLIDKTGRVVYEHFGEGEYDTTEHNIQVLLGPTSKANSQKPVASGKNNDDDGRPFIGQTPETYLGYARSDDAFASPEGVQTNAVVSYTFPGFLSLHSWALNGKWQISSEKITAQSPGASLRLNFLAKKVFLVLGTANKQPIQVKILLNGKPASNSPLTVQGHSLYTVLNLSKVQNAQLELQAQAAGLEAYAFTFGG